MRQKIEPGSKAAPDTYYVVVSAVGPYLVFGNPPMKEQFIMPDKDGSSWYFKAGKSFSTDKSPTALCRCGGSAHKPYCDGSHTKTDWDPTLTASEQPILDDAEVFRGQEVMVSDNRKYCAFARFCDAKGQIWNLAGEHGSEARELTIREANHCPGGRLSAWQNGAHVPIEPDLKPALGLIEDPQIGCSGPLWVMGGIAIKKENGFTYEIRNRVTLCRCGQSSNKPYCDGTHASFKFQDGLSKGPDPDGEEF